MALGMSKNGHIKKPTPDELQGSLQRARFIFGIRHDGDDYHGMVAREIIGPLLWYLSEATEILRETYNQIREDAYGSETEDAQAIRQFLEYAGIDFNTEPELDDH
jgi:hypothetical protein